MRRPRATTQPCRGAVFVLLQSRHPTREYSHTPPHATPRHATAWDTVAWRDGREARVSDIGAREHEVRAHWPTIATTLLRANTIQSVTATPHSNTMTHPTQHGWTYQGGNEQSRVEFYERDGVKMDYYPTTGAWGRVTGSISDRWVAVAGRQGARWPRPQPLARCIIHRVATRVSRGRGLAQARPLAVEVWKKKEWGAC
jgi:hypothetical protein